MCRARAWNPPKISFRPKQTGRPICRASSGTISSAIASMASTAAVQNRARSASGVFRHFCCACCASASAASISACVAQGRSATIDPSIGETIFTIFMILEVSDVLDCADKNIYHQGTKTPRKDRRKTI